MEFRKSGLRLGGDMMSGRTILVSLVIISMSLSLSTLGDQISIDSSEDSVGYIEGWITFNNTPLASHIVSLCRDTGDSLVNIPNTKVRTDPNGHYLFLNVPDGKYGVYAHHKDNPSFFNRFKRIEIINGNGVTAEEIKQGGILRPIYPAINAVIASPNFEWLELGETIEYHLKVWEEGTSEVLWRCRTVDPFITPRSSELALDAGKTYRWSVRALNDSAGVIGLTHGCGSPPWIFTVAKEYIQSEEPEVEYKTDNSRVIKLPFKTRVNLGDFDIEYSSINGIRVWFKESNESFVFIWGTRQNQVNRFPGYETQIISADFEKVTMEVKETAERAYYGYSIYYDFRKGERIDFPNGRSLEFRNMNTNDGKTFAEIDVSNKGEQQTLHLTSMMEYKLGFVDVWISSEIGESLIIECQDPRRALFHCRGKGSTEPVE